GSPGAYKRGRRAISWGFALTGWMECHGYINSAAIAFGQACIGSLWTDQARFMQVNIRSQGSIPAGFPRTSGAIYEDKSRYRLESGCPVDGRRRRPRGPQGRGGSGGG